MGSYQAPGSGIIDSGDKRITRKVVVATGGERPSAPGGDGRLTNVSITSEPGGITRGVFEYTKGGAGDASYNVYGYKVELLGGSREVPIYCHPKFSALTNVQVNEVEEEMAKKPSERKKFFDNATQNSLYQCLIRQVEYYLAPSLVARVSRIESSVPSTDGLCKFNNPTGVGTPSGSQWLLTGITANPIGDKFEVTREYTAIQQPQVAQFLYSNS